MKDIVIRSYQETDFDDIHNLNTEEGWFSLVERQADVRQALQQSNPVLVALDHDKVIGYLRAITDTQISLYVCELLLEVVQKGAK
ncbi:hypothetical protein [Radiobacillus sp. PE A8.2]|uniref:hypothetical protein n=1 Tax=Radiobacillus sp. PE A8.2 TaxID=3380349 RepID=UPI00389084FC